MVNKRECFHLKERNEEEKQYITKRLNIIKGQMRGVYQMVNEDRYCDDVLNQLLAIEKSLRTLNYYILEHHLRTCAVEDIKAGKVEIIDELMDFVKKLN